MVKNGPDLFILKFTEPLQRYLLTCQANSALMAGILSGLVGCKYQASLFTGCLIVKYIK